jgi:transposase
MLKYSVGLDIGSKQIYACISCIDSNQIVRAIASKIISNSNAGYKALMQWIEKYREIQNIPLVIGMEATGIYHEECAYYLHEQNYSVVIVLPNQAKKYLQASGLKSKNDKIDAKGLSQMFAERSFRLWQPMGKFYYELRVMTRHQQSLKEIKTMVMNQCEALKRGAFANKLVLKMQEVHIKNLEKHITLIEAKIEEHLKSNEEIQSKIKNVLSIKGIGKITLAILIAETNGFLLFENSRQLVSYAGYDIVENQSGNHRGKTRISKKGNSRIRRAMHMPSLSAVTCKCKPFSDLYQRTFEKHKIKMKSFVAVQKKMLIIVYSIWKKDVQFTESYSVENTRDIELASTSLDSLAQAE